MELAKRHRCLLIYLHHTGKRLENQAPSKNNLIGSQGLEAKMRVVVEMRKDPTDARYRHLCIVKANYLDESYKTHSYKLQFNSNMTFTNTGERVAFQELVPGGAENENIAHFRQRAIELFNEGVERPEIVEILEREGCPRGRTTIYKWLQGM